MPEQTSGVDAAAGAPRPLWRQISYRVVPEILVHPHLIGVIALREGFTVPELFWWMAHDIGKDAFCRLFTGYVDSLLLAGAASTSKVLP